VSRQRLARLTREESRSLADLRSAGHRSAITLDSAKSSLQYAEDHVFERVSVARDYEVLAEALRHGRGDIRHDDLKSVLTVKEISGAILRNGNEIATAASLQREREMISSIDRGIGACERLGGSNQFAISDRLTPEQKQVVEFGLNSRDRAVNISGAAGTGKTAMIHRNCTAARESHVVIKIEFPINRLVPVEPS